METAILFSGGVDSTTSAILLSKKYSKVHLLTFNNGYGHYQFDKSKKRFLELKEKIGDKFSFSLLDSKELFEKVSVNNLPENYNKYSGFVWCLGCKLAMHAQSIVYALKNNIEIVNDGSSGQTSFFVEQSSESINSLKNFYKKYNLKFETPVYNLCREEEIEMLKSMDFNLGIRIMDRFIGIQPKCIPGELYYSSMVLLGKKPKHDKNKVLEFIKEKEKILDEYIKKEIE